VDGSVWYKWTPTAVGSLTLSFTGGTPDAYLLVWEQDGSGSSPTGELSQVAGTDASAPAPLTILSLDAGSTYYISLGSSGVEGVVKVKVVETVTGPSISKLSTTSGKIAGGTKVTITGKNLTDVNEVDLGSPSTNGLNLVHGGSTKLTFTTPAVLDPGKVYVQLDTSTSEQSVINTAAHFTYK
jgi:hypothetical protein